MCIMVIPTYKFWGLGGLPALRSHTHQIYGAWIEKCTAMCKDSHS